MFVPRIQALGLFLLFTTLSFSQVLDDIKINLTILEKVGNQTRALPNAKIQIPDEGQVLTNESGQYNYNYAVRNNVDPEIKISLISDEHKMLKPLDGAIQLDPTQEEINIEFLVVNMAEESPEFQKRIKKLERRIARLQSKNQLTQIQLNKINAQLLDTILYFEARRQELEGEIANYESLNQEQQEQIESQKNRIAELEEEVSNLTEDLEEALEARYLRQNKYFKDISTNLLQYLLKVKDLRDHMPYIREYFKSGFGNFASDIDAYNKVFTTLNNNHQDYLEGVDRYWENRPVSRQMESVFKYLLEGIHLKQVMPVINDINMEIRKRKPKKAHKIAMASHENMIQNIRQLEKDVNRLLIKLRKSS